MLRIFGIICLILLSWQTFLGQNKKAQESAFSCMFYNTENTFDYFDDPGSDDSEFLPNSKRHWTKEKYINKLNNLSKVILSTGLEPPSIIGLAEIENYKVLNDLINNTGLSKFNYKIIHYESPDPRGIDVAVLYRSDNVKILKSKAIRINFGDAKKRTRDIIYVKVLAEKKDTLHFFVNHWPSRRGGKKASERSRNFVALQLKNNVDSVLSTSPFAKIIITGDFNDEPEDKSIQLLLRKNVLQSTNLINLSQLWTKDLGYIGTHYFKGHWGILDQIIVSSTLLNKDGIYCTNNSARIHSASFLLQENQDLGGKVPFRTFAGFHYTGGFSDHLPIILDLRFE